jgi:MSHA biogenesis protein MshO
VSGECIEFVPAKVVGTYYDTPIRPDSSNEMTLVTFAGSSYATNIDWGLDGTERVFIYATRPNFIYANNPQRYANIEGNPSFNSVESLLPLEPNSKFAKESPLKRAYIGSTPVSFCLSAGNLFRVSGYGWTQGQTEWTSGDLIATGVSSDDPFDVTANNKQSNNIVTIQLQFGENAEEQVFYYREVHIPNAP